MSEEIVNNEQDLNEILRIRREKLARLVDEGKNPYEITRFDKTHSSEQILGSYVDPVEGEEYVPMRVTVAGRMISRRIMGKASFCHILDGDGTIQLYVKRDEVGEEAYAEFKTWDIGDIIGGEGEVFRTHMGEISVAFPASSCSANRCCPCRKSFTA